MLYALHSQTDAADRVENKAVFYSQILYGYKARAEQSLFFQRGKNQHDFSVRLAGFKRFVNGSHYGGNSRFVVASEHGSAVGGDFAVVGKDGLDAFAGFHRVDVRGKENGSLVFARFVGFYDNLYLLRFLFKLVGGQTFLHVIF